MRSVFILILNTPGPFGTELSPMLFTHVVKLKSCNGGTDYAAYQSNNLNVFDPGGYNPCNIEVALSICGLEARV